MENKNNFLKEEMKLLALLEQIPYGYRQGVLASIKTNGFEAVIIGLGDLLTFVRFYPLYGVLINNCLLLGYTPCMAVKEAQKQIQREMCFPKIDKELVAKPDFLPIDWRENLNNIKPKELEEYPILDVLPDYISR